MVNINQYLNVGSNTPGIATTPIDQQSILNSGNQVTSVANQLLGQDLQDADQSRRESLRANIILKETQHQTQLKLQESYLKTNEILLDSLNKITSIDEAQRKEEERKNAILFNVNSFSKMNTDYTLFLDEANQTMSPDGSGYTQSVQGFLDSQIEQYVNSAPNEEAKLDFYTRASEFKMRAIQQSLEVEGKARDRYRIGLIDDSANQIINQTTLNPQLGDIKSEELTKLKPILIQNGFNEGQADAFIKNKSEDLREFQVQSLLEKGQGNDAEDLLKREDIINSLKPETYNKLNKAVLNYQAQVLKEQKKEMELAIAVEAYNTELLPKGDPMFGKAADVSADSLLFSQLPSRPNFTVDNVPQTSGMINQYFKQHPNGIGPQTANKIENVVNSSSNPFEVVGYSLGITSILTDPTGRSQEVIKSLSKDTVTLASRITALTSTGTPSQEAVILAKKELEDTKNPILNEWIKEVIKDQEPYKLLEKALDKVSIWYPTDSAEPIKGDAEDLFAKNLNRYKNIDLATEATVSDIKNKYAVTDVNGSNEVMEAAPGMFFNGETLVIFKDNVNIGRQMIGAELEGEDNGDGTFNTPRGRIKPIIKPIQNVTLNQPTDKKTYIWYDEFTGAPILNPKTGAIAQFDFNYDNNIYTKEIKNQIEQLKIEQANVAKTFEGRINQYLEKFDKFATNNRSLVSKGFKELNNIGKDGNPSSLI